MKLYIKYIRYNKYFTYGKKLQNEKNLTLALASKVNTHTIYI